MKTFFIGREPIDFFLNPIPRTRTHNLIAPRPRRPQPFSYLRSLAAAHQNLILEEPFKLADRLLEVPLLILFDLALVNKYGFIDRIIDPLHIQLMPKPRTITRLQAHKFGGERRVDLYSIAPSPRHETLNSTLT